MTACTNPRSLPRLRSTAVSPHIPGLFRPQLRQTSSLTPTSLPHEGQSVEPVRGRRSMAAYSISPTPSTRQPHSPSAAAVREGVQPGLAACLKRLQRLGDHVGEAAVLHRPAQAAVEGDEDSEVRAEVEAAAPGRIDSN